MRERMGRVIAQWLTEPKRSCVKRVERRVKIMSGWAWRWARRARKGGRSGLVLFWKK